MTNTQIQPYLFFAGRCQEAIDFYRHALDAKVEMVMRYDESPESVPPDRLPAGFETKIMHCALRIAGNVILASDGCDEKTGFSNFSLAMSVPTEADVDRIFSALADGGQVQMHPAKTFWSPRYGMVTDRFGVAWMVMVPGEVPAGQGKR
jgi:PhnB protein